MSGNEETPYNNINRAFLQVFLARSTLTFEESKPILAAIFTAYGERFDPTGLHLEGKLLLTDAEKRETLPEDVTETDFNAYITAANNAISPFDLEIRSTLHQTTKSRIYALVNSTSDPMTQLATTHSADEISFLKRILDAMFETYNTQRQEIIAITSMQALRLTKPSHEDVGETQNGSTTQGSAGQGITMMQAEKVLKTLVEEGWFEKSKKGYYSLSPRTLMELRGWLIETYNDLGEEEDEEDDERVLRVKLCYACRDIITVGQRCSTRSCNCRLHDICTQNFFRVQKSKKCPLCKADWTGTDFVGERAVVRKEKQAKQRSAGGGSSTRKGTRAVTDEAEVISSGEDDGDA